MQASNSMLDMRPCQNEDSNDAIALAMNFWRMISDTRRIRWFDVTMNDRIQSLVKGESWSFNEQTVYLIFLLTWFDGIIDISIIDDRYSIDRHLIKVKILILSR